MLLGFIKKLISNGGKLSIQFLKVNAIQSHLVTAKKRLSADSYT